MRIDQTFDVARPPESVFDYMTNPANLSQWQTSKTRVEVLTDAGARVRFIAEGPLRGPMRLLEPLVKRAIDRRFREYHENLRRNVEAQT